MKKIRLAFPVLVLSLLAAGAGPASADTLRKLAECAVSSLGATSTLADPSVVDDLVKNRVG